MQVYQTTIKTRRSLYLKLSLLLLFILAVLGAFAQSAQTINPTGGAGLTDGLKIVVNPTGYLSVYRNNVAQYCCGNIYPNGAGGGVQFTFRFSKDDGVTTYNNTDRPFNICSTTPAVQVGNSWTTSMSGYVISTISGKRFYVTINVKYTHPDHFFYVDYIVRAPADLPTAERVHMYLYHDANILGSDASRGYMSNNATGQFVGDYRLATDNSSSCPRYNQPAGISPSSHGFKTSGTFRSYQSASYATVYTYNLNANNSYANMINTASCIDDGVGVEFTVGPLAAGQTGTREVAHCYGDDQFEFDNLPVADPPIPSVSTPVTVDFVSSAISEYEGNTTHTPASLKIRVSNGNLAQQEICNFTIDAGTAAVGSDYNYQAGFIIPAGDYSTPREFVLDNFSILGNTTVQGNRSFTATIVDGTACNDMVQRGSIFSTTYTIVDDDVPTVSLQKVADLNTCGSNTSIYNVLVGNSCPNPLTLTLDMAGSTVVPTDFSAGTPTAWYSNIPNTTTITIPAYTTSYPVYLTANSAGNNVLGDVRTLNVRATQVQRTTTLGDVSGSIAANPADRVAISVADCDDVPAKKVLSINVTPNAITELPGATPNTATFTVSLPAGITTVSSISVPLTYSTASATAADYTLIPAGAATSIAIVSGNSTSFTLTAVQDSKLEDDETITVTAGAPTGFTVNSGASAQTVTIHDYTPGDVVAEKFAPAGSASESPLVHGTFRLRFKDASVTPVRPVTVTFALSGTAVRSDDYTTPNPTTAIIPANQNYVDVPITVNNNLKVDGTRDVIITITNVNMP